MEDVQSLQLVAMRDMYLRYPEGKWYYIVGDDMFVVVDELRRMLATYDETLDYWLVNYSGTRILPDNFNTTEWPNRVPMIDQKKIFAWQVSPFSFLHKFFLYTNNRGVNSLLFVFVLVILQKAGSTGWFLSNSVAKLVAEHVEYFANLPTLGKGCNCPDIYSGLLISLVICSIILLL